MFEIGVWVLHDELCKAKNFCVLIKVIIFKFQF